MQMMDSMELNSEGLEMQQWTTPTDRAQKLDEENGVICVVIVFTPIVIVIKMSEMAQLYFLFFFADDSKWKL